MVNNIIKKNWRHILIFFSSIIIYILTNTYLVLAIPGIQFLMALYTFSIQNETDKKLSNIESMTLKAQEMNEEVYNKVVFIHEKYAKKESFFRNLLQKGLIDSDEVQKVLNQIGNQVQQP